MYFTEKLTKGLSEKMLHSATLFRTPTSKRHVGGKEDERSKEEADMISNRTKDSRFEDQREK